MKLFADSCADLSLEETEKRGIEVLPLTITIDDESYRDQIDISSAEVLQSIKDGKRPTTSQANPENFVERFMPYVEGGEPILYIAFSSELSGTYQSAVIAKDTILDEHPEADITLIDTKAASYGLGLIVERASDDIQNGLPKEEVIENVRKNVKNIRHFFTVNDLDYLAKGGRLSKGSAFLGGLLNIKPLLHVEDGKLVPLEKHRGLKKVFKSMVNHLNKDNVSGKAHIVQSDAQDSAEQLKEKLLSETDIEEVNISLIGPTIASHTGNGTIALFYFNEGV
ncbi:DegV family protein [Lacicoccus alkaliphilus]|uniref:EDD domain protein, DegV family n=1 Tax=Lacicoccus alkaliphilus DSM 16010 TaxID=1123231 RepID=A0A1M7G979_9BACL|nr:DegV family protein [Salinicoccus alkaliphilus]SHM12675.1 EDD domain protein, DegV family [Salinicoccus alkaliphilus DSM 16010]